MKSKYRFWWGFINWWSLRSSPLPDVWGTYLRWGLLLFFFVVFVFRSFDFLTVFTDIW